MSSWLHIGLAKVLEVRLKVVRSRQKDGKLGSVPESAVGLRLHSEDLHMQMASIQLVMVWLGNLQLPADGHRDVHHEQGDPCDLDASEDVHDVVRYVLIVYANELADC